MKTFNPARLGQSLLCCLQSNSISVGRVTAGVLVAGSLAVAAQATVPRNDTAVSNPSLARVFTELTHEVEGGAARPHLVRYEGPVSVAIEGPGASRYASFVDRYLGLLQRNSGIDIARRPDRANLHVRLVDGSFARVAPGLSCLMAPGNVSWAELRANPHAYSVRAAARASSIGHMTVFIPTTNSAHRIKSCLIEEIAQALGPANDLYGLGASVFNDDDAHFWPTELDYLMLRVLYSPELRTGLDREATERKARQVLDRINPTGVGAPAMDVPEQHRMAGWRDLVERASSHGAVAVAPAEQALAIAEAEAPGSTYHCHSLIMVGKALGASDPAQALGRLGEAERVCRQAHGDGDVRLAWIGMHRARTLLELGRYGEAIPLTEAILPAAEAREEDGLTASLQSIRQQAFAALGRPAGAGDGQRLTSGLRATGDAYAVERSHGLSRNSGARR